jgi:hypothetical protein
MKLRKLRFKRGFRVIRGNRRSERHEIRNAGRTTGDELPRGRR